MNQKNQPQESKSALSASERSEAADSADSPPAGAPSCNTAPANSIGKILRSGLDSLYLSIKGQLSEEADQLLAEFKTRAQADDEKLQATARIQLAGHHLCVSDRGRRKFAYVLDDNWFSIALSSRSARSLPLAHTQISSEALTGFGPEACESQLVRIVKELGEVSGAPSISRADLYADFCLNKELNPGALDPKGWITRPRKRARYDAGDFFTGYAFGQGSKLSARLYDKTRELRKSGKDYLRGLWAAEGWDGVSPVWRLEFQCARDALPEPMTASLDAFLPNLPTLWQYLIRDWLRLTVPNSGDETRSRWPNHPLWDLMALAQPSAQGSGVRVRKERVPSDDTLFKTGLWAISSFMAREGISEMDEAFGEYMFRANEYHASFQEQGRESMAEYLQRKAVSKSRRYNTPVPGTSDE